MGQADIALRLVWLEVHRAQQVLATAALPGEAEETLPGPVPLPCRGRLEQSPSAGAQRRVLQPLQQVGVERANGRVGFLPRRTVQVDGDVLPAPLELPLMEEAEPRREKGDDRCGLVHIPGE